MGSLTGTSILGAKATEKSRRSDIAKLNYGTLDGLVVTDKMGATGYDLVAANHIIFLGSLYSLTMERQAIGISRFLSLLTTLGRITRRLQRRVPKAYIIASPSFPGDNAALEMKRQRGEEDEAMIRRISETELRMLSDQFSGVDVRADGNLEYNLTGEV